MRRGNTAAVKTLLPDPVGGFPLIKTSPVTLIRHNAEIAASERVSMSTPPDAKTHGMMLSAVAMAPQSPVHVRHTSAVEAPRVVEYIPGAQSRHRVESVAPIVVE